MAACKQERAAMRAGGGAPWNAQDEEVQEATHHGWNERGSATQTAFTKKKEPQSLPHEAASL